MITVYRPDGVAEEKDPVDACECVRHCGYSYAPVLAVDSQDTAGDGSKASAKRKAALKGSDAGLD